MTFIQIQELEKRRAEGLSPKGGPAPAGALSEVLQAPADSVTRRLDALLALQWDHPLDCGVMRQIVNLVGERHSRAVILSAADHVRRAQNGQEPCDLASSAYADLVKAVEK